MGEGGAGVPETLAVGLGMGNSSRRTLRRSRDVVSTDAVETPAACGQDVVRGVGRWDAREVDGRGVDEELEPLYACTTVTENSAEAFGSTSTMRHLLGRRWAMVVQWIETARDSEEISLKCA